ncbi:hypothetical protein BDV97DRAFT_366453 [Delphinella strobiligena]|nr:hypothetical protein BDV97DRAFT_366453 [Delphinella strobiligena]
MTASAFSSRYQLCHLLRTHEIPCVVWFEDAVGHYGVPTCVFDLYVLVPDIDTAAQILIQHGWKLISQQRGRIGNATVDSNSQRRLTTESHSSEDSNSQRRLTTVFYSSETNQICVPIHPWRTDTVLLPVTDWKFKLGAAQAVKISPSSIFPPLAGLLDALIESSLDCFADNRALAGHIDLHIAYLYDYVPEIRERTFAESLKYEHRQYHFDVLSGMSSGTIPFNKHQLKIREALRQNTHELQECSASREDEALFNDGVQARLLASLPDPFSKDVEGDEKVEHQSFLDVRQESCAKHR